MALSEVVIPAVIQGPGRPEEGYFMRDGTQVPGVTTVVNRVKDSGAIIGWAWKQGKLGKPLNEARDKACSVGKIAHAMIEADIHGREWSPQETDLAEMIEKARKALSMWLKWKAQTRFRPVLTETPLVHETFRYGGTPDGVAYVGDELVLYDLKSSNGIYQDHLLQIGAYRRLVNDDLSCPNGSNLDEALDGDGDVAGGMIIRVGKDAPTFATQYWDAATMDLAFTGFQAALAFYALDKQLKEAM